MSKIPPSHLSAHRPLGKIFEASALGFGTLPLTGAYGPCDSTAAMAVLKAALDCGINLVDTADVYGFGQVETWIGEAIKGRRQDVIISSKCGFDFTDRDNVKLNGRPDYILKAADASLKRLKIDEIDLYMLQAIDPKVPLDETIGAMGELVVRGKLRAIGICGAPFQAIETAMRIFPLSAVGMAYSLLACEEADELRALTSPLGLAFLAFEPLGKGILTDERGDPMVSLAKKLECSKAQLALAYLLCQGRDVIPVFGTRTVERIYENIGAANVHLSSEDIGDLRDRFKSSSGPGVH